jgi:C4-dicarboxylate-specific signal transduction histidine kinase
MTGAASYEDLERRLELTELALQRCERLAVAGRYAGAIMHEVNNPLAAITNLVFLSELQVEDPKQVLRNLKVIEQQLVTLSRVTRQVLSFHRDEPVAREYDLIEIVESALKLHSARMTSGNVAVTKDFRAPAIASVFGSDILQVVSNLLLNALDALPNEDAQLMVRVQGLAGHVHITVCDNGCGMSAETLKELFKPHMTTKAAGTGLGLWVSMRIVTKHQGKLRVRSTQRIGRQGTAFRLSLPLKAAA